MCVGGGGGGSICDIQSKETLQLLLEYGRLCMRLVLVSLLFHYMRYSMIDLSLLHLKRASETQNHLTFLTGYSSTKGQETS